jgi:hypothetical protein
MAKKHPSRPYKKEYARFHSKPKEKKRRALRNKARRRAIKKHGRAALKGKDVHHVKGIKGPTRVISKRKNRSFRRSKTGKNLGLRK